MGMEQSSISWIWKVIVILAVGIIMASLFLLDSLIFSAFDYSRFQNISLLVQTSAIAKPVEGIIHDERNKEKNTSIVMYQRLLSLASSALTEKELRDEPPSLWKEPNSEASSWKPCANRTTTQEISDKPIASNGFILVSANGGLNEQRVAICNAVGVAVLLNATLVIPRFLYSSQFGDVYQEDYFIDTMYDVNIVKELPPHLRSLDLEAIGSVITDPDLVKEAKPNDFFGLVLPLLIRNGVVHFLGFGNRLGFDSLPSQAQVLKISNSFSGSQMSSVVSGFRTYFGGGQAPTLRPNHKRLALMLQKNGTITWSEFEDKAKKMIEEGQRVSIRGYGRNLYRLPRDLECMCRSP